MAVLAERYGRACQNSPDVVNLEHLWGHFGVTLGTLWGHFGVLWVHFGVFWLTFSSLWRLLVDFFVTLASFGRLFRQRCVLWATLSAQMCRIHTFPKFFKGRGENGQGCLKEAPRRPRGGFREASRRPRGGPREAMGKQAAPPYEVYTSY